MGGKVHIYVMDTITHVGEFLYVVVSLMIYIKVQACKAAKPLDEDTKIK